MGVNLLDTSNPFGHDKTPRPIKDEGLSVRNPNSQ